MARIIQIKLEYHGFANWDDQVEKVRKYAREHPEKLKQQMKSYFNLSDAQMAELFK